jgi:hypothetical protein
MRKFPSGRADLADGARLKLVRYTWRGCWLSANKISDPSDQAEPWHIGT